MYKKNCQFIQHVYKKIVINLKEPINQYVLNVHYFDIILFGSIFDAENYINCLKYIEKVIFVYLQTKSKLHRLRFSILRVLQIYKRTINLLVILIVNRKRNNPREIKANRISQVVFDWWIYLRVRILSMEDSSSVKCVLRRINRRTNMK